MKRGTGKKMPPGVRKMYCFKLSEGERDLLGGFEQIMKYGDLQACFDFVLSKVDTVQMVSPVHCKARI